MFATIFRQLGLNPEEAKIYQSLLEHGVQSAAQLANTASIKRTYVYTLINGLIRRGLVTQQKTSKTTVFAPQSPDKLLELAEVQKQESERARQALENVLPSLKSLYSLTESKPVVTYFEGVEGIKKVYLDTLKELQPILALVETSKVEPEIYHWVTQTYAARRGQAKIPVKAIVASGPQTEKYQRLNEKELRETKIISSSKYPLEHEINIYGHKVAIINHKQGTKLVGIIIDNPVIAQTFRSWFNLTWNQLA